MSSLYAITHPGLLASYVIQPGKCLFYSSRNLHGLLQLSFFSNLHYSQGQLTVNYAQVNSALHPSGVAKSSTSFGWGKSGKVTAAEWQVTLCDPIWHVISRRSVVISTDCYMWFTSVYSHNSDNVRPRTDLLRMWLEQPSDDTAMAMYAARRTIGSVLCNAGLTWRICTVSQYHVKLQLLLMRQNFISQTV